MALSMKETNPEVFQDLLKRMKRIEGQARGIQRLLEEDASCEEIVNQLSAMRAALSRVAVKAAACQLGQLMAEEIEGGGTGRKASAEMMEIFMRLG